MGVHLTAYYIGMALLQPLTGLARDLTGSPSAPLIFGGIILFLNILVFCAFAKHKDGKVQARIYQYQSIRKVLIFIDICIGVV